MTFTLERNVLGVPTFVLNPKSAEKLEALTHTWTNDRGLMEFTYSKSPKTPFPLVEHARYFDALIGLFSDRWNPEGYLFFSVAEVLRFAGKGSNNGGNRKAVLEAIRRYQFCQASWEQSWKGGKTTWVGSLIPESDIWNFSTGELKRNPRNSRTKESLHKIRFNEHIVNSLKDSNTRVFMTESIKSLKPDSYAVYRYFYGFSDQSKIRRKIEKLDTVFPWTGRKSRFQPWLEKRLEECFQKGFLEGYELKDGYVSVKCKSLKEYKDNAPVIEIKQRAKKTTRTKTKKVSTTKMTPEALLEEYYRRKQLGDIKPEHADIIDMMISSGQQDLTVSLLRNHLGSK